MIFGHLERCRHSPSIVLVVDNYPPMRALVSEFLTKEGYQVWLADSGKTALTTLMEVEGQVDLLLLDLHIPDIDGFTVASIVRLAWSSIPIIFMSGFESSHTFRREQKRALKFHPLLKKPFTRHDLMTLLQSTMRCISLRTKPNLIS